MQVSGLEIEVGQIKVRLEMPRVVFQRVCETVERLGHPGSLEFENPQIAVGIRRIVLVLNPLPVGFGRPAVAAFMQEQRLLERAEPYRQPNELPWLGERVLLA